MSRQWLVVTKWLSITTYSLPDLKLQDLIVINGEIPTADSAGVVYLPGWKGNITMLEISDSGNISKLGELTVEGQLGQGRVRVAAGPRLGELCVGRVIPPNIYIVNISTDTIIHTLEFPIVFNYVGCLATTETGQILVASSFNNLKLAWYRSVTEPAKLLDGPDVMGEIVMVGNIN